MHASSNVCARLNLRACTYFWVYACARACACTRLCAERVRCAEEEWAHRAICVACARWWIYYLEPILFAQQLHDDPAPTAREQDCFAQLYFSEPRNLSDSVLVGFNDAVLRVGAPTGERIRGVSENIDPASPAKELATVEWEPPE